MADFLALLLVITSSFVRLSLFLNVNHSILLRWLRSSSSSLFTMHNVFSMYLRVFHRTGFFSEIARPVLQSPLYKLATVVETLYSMAAHSRFIEFLPEAKVGKSLVAWKFSYLAVQFSYSRSLPSSMLNITSTPSYIGRLVKRLDTVYIN